MGVTTTPISPIGAKNRSNGMLHCIGNLRVAKDLHRTKEQFNSA